MNISIIDDLPHVTAIIKRGENEATFNKVLLDTGSVGSVFFEAIIGFDFLQQTGAVIDLSAMEIRSDG